MTPGAGGYIYDDAGRFGGLPEGARFVVLGHMNADPFDGNSVDSAIRQLLDNPAVDASLRPASSDGPEQAALQGGANATHGGDPAFDTADFADTAPGNLRAAVRRSVVPARRRLRSRAARRLPEFRPQAGLDRPRHRLGVRRHGREPRACDRPAPRQSHRAAMRLLPPSAARKRSPTKSCAAPASATAGAMSKNSYVTPW